jgi:hypothetical protein
VSGNRGLKPTTLQLGAHWLGSVQPGSDQANVGALLQSLSVQETQCRFMTLWSTIESSSSMLIIILSLPGHVIIADISSQASFLRKIS